MDGLPEQLMWRLILPHAHLLDSRALLACGLILRANIAVLESSFWPRPHAQESLGVLLLGRAPLPFDIAGQA